MDIQLLHKTIYHLSLIDPNNDYQQVKCWEELKHMLSKNVEETIDFINNFCNDDELYWISAIFADVAEITKSKELITAIKNRLAEVTPARYNKNNFKSEHMKKWVDYSEYVRSILIDIQCAEKCFI